MEGEGRIPNERILNEDEKRLLAAAAESALESMFFEALECEPEEGESPDQDVLRVVVRYRGSRRGRLAVAASRATAARLAANFLGLESDGAVEDALGLSTLSEFANIVCGSFLSRLDSQGCYQIDPPGTEEGPAGGRWLKLTSGAGTVWVRLVEE